MRASLTHLIEVFASARQARLVETRAMATFWCEWKERGDPETGDGTPACRHARSDMSEWCAACQAREPHFQAMQALKRVEQKAHRRLLAFLDRRATPQAVDAVDPVDGVVTGSPRA